jgi:hypothetical protein
MTPEITAPMITEERQEQAFSEIQNTKISRIGAITIQGDTMSEFMTPLTTRRPNQN